jgi:hypothetical protein
MASHRTKYRPYFTSEEMLEIIFSLKQSPSPTRLKIIQYLESFSLKITHGIIEPSHINKPSLAESLGFSDSLPIKQISPNERRENAYHKWLHRPTQCTPAELKDVNEYRYANHLFTPEEQVSFEKSVILGM